MEGNWLEVYPLPENSWQERVDFIESFLGDNAQKHSEARLRAFSLTAWTCQRLRECRLCRLCRLCQCMSEWDIWWYLAQGVKSAPDSRFPPLGLASKVCWVDHGPLRRPCCKSTASNAPWCLCHRAPWKAWLPPLAELPSWGQRIQASFKKVWAPWDWWWWVLQGGTSSGQSRDEEKDRAEFGAWSFQSHLFPSSSSEKAAQQSFFRSLIVWSWLTEPRRDGNDGRTGLLDPAGGNWWIHLPSGSSPCSECLTRHQQNHGTCLAGNRGHLPWDLLRRHHEDGRESVGDLRMALVALVASEVLLDRRIYFTTWLPVRTERHGSFGRIDWNTIYIWG